MKRLGQARGRACAPAHWLVLAPDPVSGPRVPGRCHHPSSQPPLPPTPLTSLLRVPSPRQRLTLGAGTGRARTRRSSGGGRRAGLGLHAPHLCRRARGSRHGAGAARERRDARRCPSGTRLQTSGGRLRAVPQQRQRPRRGGGTSPRRPALRARSSVHRDPRPGQLRPRRVRGVRSPLSPPRGPGTAPELRGWTGRRVRTRSREAAEARSCQQAGEQAPRAALPPPPRRRGIRAAVPRRGARGRHRAALPARGRLVMLPKVETEALGLARSHGDQGQMPENMQGKRARRSGSRGHRAPRSAHLELAAQAAGPAAGPAPKFRALEPCAVGGSPSDA